MKTLKHKHCPILGSTYFLEEDPNRKVKVATGIIKHGIAMNTITLASTNAQASFNELTGKLNNHLPNKKLNHNERAYPEQRTKPFKGQ
jgi:hypothetical protein